MNFNIHILISLGLVIFALILFFVLRRVENGLKVLAMFCGFLGDMTLAHFWIFDNLNFEWGVAFFLICHIFYFFAYKRCVKNLFNKGFWIGVIISLLFIGTLIFMFFLNERSLFMLVLSLIYGGVIGFLCATVTSYAYERKSLVSILNTMGIIFFIISDFFIGINIVAGVDFPTRSQLIWIFYPIGQFLLILDWNKKG